MELNFSKINGTNAHLNYELLKANIIEKLSPKCIKADVIVINNFPVPVSSQSTLDIIIIINIPNIDNSWYNVEVENKIISIKNQIIAISVVDDYSNSIISNTGDDIEIDGGYVDFQEPATKLKWGVTNYLANYCGLIRNRITIHPIIWIKNDKANTKTQNVVIGNTLNYQDIEDVISLNYYFKWSGYLDWYNKSSLFDQNIKTIFEQASRDSATGFLTKKKIERIQKSLDNASQKAFDNIGTKLVEVKGKAGTGKSSDILKWMLLLSLKGKRGVFLTFNHLLVYDISSQIQSFHNQLSSEKRRDKKSTTTSTIHSFFYNLAKKLGVLLLLSEKRILELITLLDSRWESIEPFFDDARESEPNMSLNKLLMHVQLEFKTDEGTKREAIYFLQNLKKKQFLNSKEVMRSNFLEYRKEKIKKLSDLESSDIFLKDYNMVLERIFQATSSLDVFIKDLDVLNKYDLLEIPMNLKDSILNNNGSGEIDLEKLKTRYRKSLGGIKSGRLVFVDEAQDCHPLERDIIINIFGSNNIVIANGDKEQLIRYSRLCDWHISKSRNIDFYRYSKKQKSFRMKPAIAALANHIADYFGIDLNIESIDTEDHGSIVIDVNPNSKQQIKFIDDFNKIGSRQGCTAYESVLLLRNSNSNTSSSGFSNPDNNESVIINEYNNIVDDTSNLRSNWQLLDEASREVTDYRFWNATGNVDKREMSIPGSLSVRSIYYESCRGIEAWSVMCFDLDGFFDSKSKESEADNYLLNDLFDQLTPDDRREMYAATWVLMAITRCIENCYIELINQNSPIFKCLVEFYKKQPNFITLNK